jgi:mRNA-degrading endonuclease RelE of RelBE toxin-antitoxin system
VTSEQSFYRILISSSAEKDMDKLTGEIHSKLSKKILSLEDNPRPRRIKKLSDRDEY